MALNDQQVDAVSAFAALLDGQTIQVGTNPSWQKCANDYVPYETIWADVVNPSSFSYDETKLYRVKPKTYKLLDVFYVPYLKDHYFLTTDGDGSLLLTSITRGTVGMSSQVGDVVRDFTLDELSDIFGVSLEQSDKKIGG